jgi:hypothetical protein
MSSHLAWPKAITLNGSIEVRDGPVIVVAVVVNHRSSVVGDVVVANYPDCHVIEILVAL